jgi:hypothetical protein
MQRYIKKIINLGIIILLFLYCYQILGSIKMWVLIQTYHSNWLKETLKIISKITMVLISLYILIYNFVSYKIETAYYNNYIIMYYEYIDKNDFIYNYIFLIKYFFYKITTFITMLLIFILSSFMLFQYYNLYLVLIDNLLIYFIGNFLIWRCPKCNKFFGWAAELTKCKNCNKEFT